MSQPDFFGVAYEIVRGVTEVEVDFGFPPRASGSFTASDASVTALSKIVAFPSGNAPTGKFADELDWSPFVCSATPGAGQVTLRVAACDQRAGLMGGKFKILYTVS